METILGVIQLFYKNTQNQTPNSTRKTAGQRTNQTKR